MNGGWGQEFGEQWGRDWPGHQAGGWGWGDGNEKPKRKNDDGDDEKLKRDGKTLYV